MKKDFYEILGLSKGAGDADVKKAYRTLARKHHPDVDSSPGAHERFKEINEAYQVLSDPQKRAAYDQYGHAAFDPSTGSGPFGGGAGQGGYRTYTWTSGGPSASSGQGDFGFDFGGFADPFDIFEAVFGSTSPFGRQARLPRYVLNLTFDEAVHGVTKEVEIEGKRQKVKIPAGVDDGTEIRFSNYVIVTQVRPHSELHRRGFDIFVEQEISFSQAALGDTVEVPTIDGPVKIRVQPGTQPGTQIRLRGRGIPHIRSSGRGDEYVIVKVVIPQKLSTEEKRLLEDLEKASKTKKKSWF